MNKTLILFAALFSLNFCGCSSTAGGWKKDPQTLSSLSQFEGAYANKSDLGYLPLTSIIFPKDRFSPDPDLVQVSVLSGSRVKVAALRDGQILKEQVFEEKKDFRISDSRIGITSKTGAGSYTGGNPDAWFTPPVAGVAALSGELFLDKDGNLIYHKSKTGAGLVFFVVPFAGSSHEYYCYKKAK